MGGKALAKRGENDENDRCIHKVVLRCGIRGGRKERPEGKRLKERNVAGPSKTTLEAR